MSAETNWTPGPWTLLGKAYPSFWAGRIVGADNITVCLHGPHAGIRGVGLRNVEANARLIAAAPETLRQRDELLAALTKLLAGCESYLAARGDALQISGMIAARAAIAAVEKEAR